MIEIVQRTRLNLADSVALRLPAMVPFFPASQVENAVSPERALEAVREAFVAYARGEWTMPPKVYVPAYPAGDFRAMPALGGGHALLKWVTSFPGNPSRGLPTVTGLVLLSNASNGTLVAVLDAAAVTAVRTGAAAVLDPLSGAELDCRLIRLRAPNRVEFDPGACDSERLGDTDGDPAELVLHVVALEERSRDCGQKRGLEGAPPSFGLARARPRRERADDERRHEVDRERDPVLSVREPKRVCRLEEEPIEREHAGDRHQQRIREPEQHRNRKYREDVENAQAEHGRKRVEGENRSGHERNGRGTREEGYEMGLEACVEAIHTSAHTVEH